MNDTQLCMTNQVSVCIPDDVRRRAKRLKINISDVCRKALSDEIALKKGEIKKLKIPNGVINTLYRILDDIEYGESGSSINPDTMFIRRWLEEECE